MPRCKSLDFPRFLTQTNDCAMMWLSGGQPEQNEGGLNTMRKESKKRLSGEIASVQVYHGGSSTGLSGYQYRGFLGNWYFNSDSKEGVRPDENGNVVRQNGQPFKGFGLEIEVQCSSIRRQAILAELLEKIVFDRFKFGADMFKMQNDSSLGGNTNAEIITQVMTKSRIRNDYQAYKLMFDEYFNSFGISADSYSTSCGMHVNVSNAIFGDTEALQAEAVKKLFYIVNKHYDLFCRAFYRCPSRTTWCHQMDYSEAHNLDLYHASPSHGNSMNLSHFPEGRIEIRLVGGQKDYYCFRNTMETVFFLCDRVRTLKWSDCDDLVKIFTGCNQYVYKRLRTECYAFITAEQLEQILETVKEEDLELRH
jgi:hypothetical protein